MSKLIITVGFSLTILGMLMHVPLRPGDTTLTEPISDLAKGSYYVELTDFKHYRLDRKIVGTDISVNCHGKKGNRAVIKYDGFKLKCRIIN